MISSILKAKFLPIKYEVLLFILAGVLLAKVDFSIDNDADFYYKKEDIFYEYQAAKDLQDGVNPYKRILESNMLENDKYATQLPLYFYTLSWLRDLSKDDFSGFIENFRNIVFISQLLGGLFIYLYFRKDDNRLVGFVSACLYMFNVWSLNSFIYLKQDMLAIALLLASFYFFTGDKNRWLAYLLYGVSLGIKHIGVFLFPLYLLPLLSKEASVKKFAGWFLVLLTVLMVPSIPLFLDSPESFARSMLFSITRSPSNSDFIFGYSNLLISYNPSFNPGTLYQQLLPRLPLLLSSVSIFLLLINKRISINNYAFLAILVFAIFNPVIFPQYITWVIPFALLQLRQKNALK